MNRVSLRGLSAPFQIDTPHQLSPSAFIIDNAKGLIHDIEYA